MCLGPAKVMALLVWQSRTACNHRRSCCDNYACCPYCCLKVNMCRTPGALSATAIKVGPTGSFAGGLVTGVSGMSTASTDSARPIKAGISEFNSDGTPRSSATPRESAYLLPPESPRAERSSDSQNRASLLGPQALSVEGSGGSLLSPSSSKKVGCKSTYSSVIEQLVCYNRPHTLMLTLGLCLQLFDLSAAAGMLST